ncbi:MAG: PaaX family transcriptional regulator [Paracoccaceae bacterium]|nr:PaaX family transcriptional regulator [Paracoccaceae bacterium]
MGTDPAIAPLIEGLPLTAAAFIVTVYGDVVMPRGEVLWMGSLIRLCGQIGISENLVRTAVSRLVAAGRLEGERAGRRSFYRLAPAARAEFLQAAHRLYAPGRGARGWLILHAPGLSDEECRRHRLARMGGDVWIGPDRDEPLPTGALVFRAATPDDVATLPAMAGFWDIPGLGARYQALLDRFRPLAGRVAAGDLPGGAEALMARLLLVHVYRGVLLRDPGLPEGALPEGWPGTAARGLFRDLYRALSPAAEAEIGATLEGEDAPLPGATPQTRARLMALG